jgi:hypothetical protein
VWNWVYRSERSCKGQGQSERGIEEKNRTKKKTVKTSTINGNNKINKKEEPLSLTVLTTTLPCNTATFNIPIG